MIKEIQSRIQWKSLLFSKAFNNTAIFFLKQNRIRCHSVVPFQTCNHVPSRSFSTFFPSFDDFTKILFLPVLLHYLTRGKYWTQKAVLSKRNQESMYGFSTFYYFFKRNKCQESSRHLSFSNNLFCYLFPYTHYFLPVHKSYSFLHLCCNHSITA